MRKAEVLGGNRMVQEAKCRWPKGRRKVALRALAEIRESAGDRDGAERAYRMAADAGDTLMPFELAWRPDLRWKQLALYGLEPNGQMSDPWW